MLLVNPNPAAIDIGDTIHSVAEPVHRDMGHVKSSSDDLEEIYPVALL